MVSYKVFSLRELLNLDIDQLKIEDAFKKFSCQREVDLENFLLHKAIPYEKTNYGKSYLIVNVEKLREGVFEILAYFTVAQKSLDISGLSNKKKRKLLGEYPGRDSLKSIPAYLIGQLGRSDNCSADMLSGQQILNECYHIIGEAALVVGGNMIVLECREHMYSKFYEGQDFKKLYDAVNDEGLFTLYKKIDFSEYWGRHESEGEA